MPETVLPVFLEVAGERGLLPPGEVFVAFWCSAQWDLLSFSLDHGGCSVALMDPCGICRRAALSGATGVIFAHNHPSGDTAFSDEDIKVTKKNQMALASMGLTLVDHIIIGQNPDGSLTYRSMRGRGVLL